MATLSVQERNRRERELRKSFLGDLIRERERRKKHREQFDFAANIKFLQALREFLGLDPIKGCLGENSR
jgi:hypothetical protein